MTVKKHLAVSSWKSGIAVFIMILAMAASVLSQTKLHGNRITEELTSGGLVRLAGTVHPLTRRATDLGEVNSGMQMDSLTLNTGMSAAQQREMDALLAAQQDPKSPQYHKWLTQEEYGTRFGLTNADLGRVKRWLESQGFTVKGVSRSRNAIHFSGKAWQVEAAFHTQMHKYQKDGENHFANATELQVPAGLAKVLLTVRGLHNFRPKPYVSKRMAPMLTLDPSNHFLAPGDWSTIYNVNALYNSGFTGRGAYVGVVGQTYVPQADIDNFRAASGLGATNLIYECIDPTAANCTGTAAISPLGDLYESDLDIEWAGGVAKDATVVFVYAPYDDQGVIDPLTSQFYDVGDALQHAVQDYTVPATGKVLPVVSMSYGYCESQIIGDTGSSGLVTAVGQQATSQGQTLLISSGDSGAAACDLQGDPSGDFPANGGEYVNVPEDSPYYTGVGGTTLNGDESSPGTYWNQTPWNQTSNVGVNSALQYIPEAAWNDTSSFVGLGSSGGGVSQIFAKPSYQPTPSNFSGTPGRFVPDVAFSATPFHDGYLVCSSDPSAPSNDCSTGIFSFDIIGGTSASTPAFAGMLALLVQTHGPQGNLNQTLYNLAANATTYAQVFHDVTTGSNIVPCVADIPAGTDPGCVGGTAGTTPTAGTMGYSATTGYDLVTGLGSINGGALDTALGSRRALTTTGVRANPNPAPLNGTTTLTATVTSTTAGTITGTVTFTLGTTTLGTASVSGGTATLSGVAVTAANGFVSGMNSTITAFYGGNSSFATSVATTGLQVTLPAATVTPSGGPVAAGGTVTLKATVSAGSGTPTGTVTFSTGTATLGSGIPLVGGVATLTGVVASAANGLAQGSDLVTASYSGDANFAASNGSFELVVFNPALPLGLSLSPGSAIAGGVGFTLTVNGANFVSNSRVLWNGAVRATTFVSSTQLTAVILLADIAKEETALITVTNPAETSSALPFVVVSSAPVAKITAASLADAADGSGNHVLSLTGTDFVAGSVVKWNGLSVISTSYVSPWQVTAVVSASEFATAAGAVVTVTNPSGTSTGFTL